MLETLRAPNQFKILWDLAKDKIDSAASILLGNHGTTTVEPGVWWANLESDTPYFSVHKDALFYQELKKLDLNEDEIDQIAQDRLRRGLLNECWEASRVPEPNYVYYFVKEVGEEIKVVHESDLHSNLDMRHALTDKIRAVDNIGKEKEGILNWRSEWLVHRRKILDTDQEQRAQLMQTTFGLLSPKKADYEVDVPYTMSQFNSARFVTPDLIEVKQWAQDLEVEQAALWANKGMEVDYLDPKDNVYQMVTKVGIKQSLIDDYEMIKKAAEVSGQKVQLTEDAKGKWQQAQKTATLNSKIYLNAIKNGVEGKTLNDLHLRLLLQVLEPFKETAAIRYTEKGVEIDLNCGPISQVNSSGKKEGGIGWCARCKRSNPCLSYCINCGKVLKTADETKENLPVAVLMLMRII